MRRLESGITGLDQILSGGFVSGSMTLLSGGTGTGKTIMGLQFLWHGLQKGEPCVFVTFEESPEDIKEDALVFGWNFDAYERKGMCKIMYLDPMEATDLNRLLAEEIEKIHAKRMVVDSTTILGMCYKDAFTIRKKLLKLVRAVKQTGCTAIFTSEMMENSKSISRFGVEEFVADAVMVLHHSESMTIPEFVRTIAVRKMRRTRHGNEIYTFDITDKGIVVNS